MGRITKILILILAILYGAYYWAVPTLVELPENITFEEYNIALKNPKVKTGLIPSIKFSAHKKYVTVFFWIKAGHAMVRPGQIFPSSPPANRGEYVFPHQAHPSLQAKQAKI